MKARIVKKAVTPQPNEKVPTVPQQQIDLSRRSLEEQLNIVKGPLYAKNGEMMREFEKLVDIFTNMIVQKENRILQLTAENADLRKELDKLKSNK